MSVLRLTPEPLTRAAFEPFGDVIETAGAEQRIINEGTTVRFHDLAAIDVADRGGRPLVNVFRARPLSLPLTVTMMERHPLGSQAFIPLDGAPFLIVAAPAGAAPQAAGLRAFVTDGRQGVNYAKGVWHHAVIAWRRSTDFLVVDRGGPGDNLVERRLTGGRPLLTAPAAR